MKKSVLLFSAFVLAGCTTSPYPPSDHFDGKKFFNPWGANATKSFSELMKWQFGGGKVDWPTKVENVVKPNLPTRVARKSVVVTFVNHATHLVQLEGLNVLTDPQFSERASPVSFAGPRRVREPGVKFENLPKIDLVVVSHNHYDHLDLTSLKRLSDRFQPLIIVPLGNAKLLESEGIANVLELDWWQARELSGGAKLTVVPSQHWSARGIFDRNRALWGGYVIEAGGVKVYFSGDTGYGPQFKDIVARLGSPDLSILPVGAYEPRWFMKVQHMNPEDAVLAHLDLRTRQSVGSHYGCFQLTNEGIETPAVELKVALAKLQVSEDAFVAPETGETKVFRF